MGLRCYQSQKELHQGWRLKNYLRRSSTPLEACCGGIQYIPPKGHVAEAGRGGGDGQNLQEAQLKVKLGPWWLCFQESTDSIPWKWARF